MYKIMTPGPVQVPENVRLGKKPFDDECRFGPGFFR